ncbi:glycosyltransferase [Candidatus Woesearchaeota archaeon]|nr:glycosyltransferase [Candidatus Woesearchaeota archaeon]
MIPHIEDYQKIVGKEVIDRLRETSEPLQGKHISHVNSTSAGGGVAEILNTLVILMNRLKIDTNWHIFKGTTHFFNITKKMHNGLQGDPKAKMTAFRKRVYLEETERNCMMNHFKVEDLVIIHDPQPVAMIEHYKKRQPWIWRCHIDIVHANSSVWNFIQPYVNKYDGIIVSMDKYRKPDITQPQHIIMPSIDPVSIKNYQIREDRRKKVLEKRGIDINRPIITQISRFDPWKDPLGVVKIWQRLRKDVPDCQLVLMGDMAADDPEGPVIYERVKEKVGENKDVHLITERNDVLVNCLQTDSQVVIQNSVREGFGLTVSEALWKGTPVITTNRGGLPLQVLHEKTGFIMNNVEEGALYCRKLMTDKALRTRLGEAGKEHVRKNFLITRHLQDYIDLANKYIDTKKE